MKQTLEEQQAQREAIERMQRTPDQVAAGIDPADPTGGKGGDFSPISAAEMRGTPIIFERNWLKLILTPLKRRVIRDEFTPLVSQWPTVLQFAASLRSPSCPGIDFTGVAAHTTIFSLSLWKIEDEEEAEAARKANRKHEPQDKPAPVTQYDVVDMVGALNTTLDASMGAICDTVWLLAKGTPGVAWPRPPLPEIGASDEEQKEQESGPPVGCVWLDDYLDDHLEIADFADLLRALLAANGRFRGSIADRFDAASVEK